MPRPTPSSGRGGAIWDRSLTLALINYAFLSGAVVLTLWGSSRIARQLEALRPTTVRAGEACWKRFREMNSLAAPLVGAVAVTVAFASAAYERDGQASALLRGGTWFVLGIALCTFLWTYVTLQLGVDRLGRDRLRPGATLVDQALACVLSGRLLSPASGCCSSGSSRSSGPGFRTLSDS